MSNLRQIKTKRIAVMLDKERVICYDLNAYAELEEMYGSVKLALDALNTNSIKAVISVLWAGLIHEETNDDGTYSITHRQVGAMIDGPSLATLMEIINEAMNDSAPEESTEKSGN